MQGPSVCPTQDLFKKTEKLRLQLSVINIKKHSGVELEEKKIVSDSNDGELE